MSIRNTYPTIRPSLNLDFARSRTLDPRITFSRTTTGTYMDSDGLIKVASADEARFDHRYVNGQLESLGLLVEESRSNLLTYSADFNNWSKVRSYISGVNVISPDGTESANKIVEDNSLGTHYVRKFPTVSADAVCAISVYVKSAERSQFAIHTYGSNGWDASLTAIYDLPTENITGTNAENCTINAVGNGWYRATYIATKNSTSGTANVDFYTALNGNVSYQGDNSSGIYLWGAQLEEGAFATSYIPTDDTVGGKTREPDNVSMEGDNFSDWYNPTEGTIVLDCTPVYDNSSNQYRRLLSIHNNSGAQTDVIQFIQAEASNQVLSAVWDGASPQSGFGKVVPSGTRHKVAFAVKENNMNSSYDGSIGTDDTSATLPVMTEMDIGSYTQFSSTRATTHYNSLRYYPRRLSNSQLQNLTK
jgi:hypothetical protein